MAQQMVAQTKTRETWDGGYDYIVRWLDREAPSEETLRLRLWNHFDTPATERGPFWSGERQALVEAINAVAGEGA